MQFYNLSDLCLSWEDLFPMYGREWLTICTLDCPSIQNHSFHIWNTTCLCVFVWAALPFQPYLDHQQGCTMCWVIDGGGALPSCQHNNPTAETFPDVPPAELGCVSFDHRATTTCYVVSHWLLKVSYCLLSTFKMRNWRCSFGLDFLMIHSWVGKHGTLSSISKSDWPNLKWWSFES